MTLGTSKDSRLDVQEVCVGSPKRVMVLESLDEMLFHEQQQSMVSLQHVARAVAEELAEALVVAATDPTQQHPGGTKNMMESGKVPVAASDLNLPHLDGAEKPMQSKTLLECKAVLAPGVIAAESKQGRLDGAEKLMESAMVAAAASTDSEQQQQQHEFDGGVMEMLRSSIVTEIPAYYVKPMHLRQEQQQSFKTNSETLIPIVNFAAPHEELVVELERACKCGFFQIVNHGTSKELLDRIESDALSFFDLPVEEKQKSTTAKKVTGPVHFGGGSRGDWRDVLKIQCAPESEVAREFWPLQPAGFRDTIQEYTGRMKAQAQELLGIMSESLGLEAGYIEAECGEPRVLLAMNFYPPCPDPTKTMGIREHSDPNTITMLLQQGGVEGLQVYQDGTWINVEPLPGALVINVGDHLQILSNGKYPSCLHRVVNNKSQSRLSISAFFSPSNSALIKPAPALVDADHPALFGEFIYQEFLKDFYKNGGPNSKVSISHFETKTA